MTTGAAAPGIAACEGDLKGQTIAVIGGSAGIGFETARQVRRAGGAVILCGRNAGALAHAAQELGAVATRAFDATDTEALNGFFKALPHQIDHVMVTAGAPHYGPLANITRDLAHRNFDEHQWLPIAVAQNAIGRVRPGGSLIFMGGVGGRARAVGLSLVAAGTAALPALIANLALEVAPIRMNLIAAGFVDTRLSASLLGDRLDARRDHLRATLPIRRVVEPADVAALAVHLMTNTAITGATFDIDGGQQLVVSSS